jgi:transposase-like protein
VSTSNRRKHSPQFKARVALDAIKENKTSNEIASRHGVHPSRVGKWKKVVLERLHEVFEHPEHSTDHRAELIERLYQEIGKLQVELEWMKNKAGGFLD